MDSIAFLRSQASKMLYCPKKNNLFKAKSAKMLYCPKKAKKKQKKPKFGDLGLLQGLEVSKLWFFLGQYGIFACFGLKRLVFLEQYSVFALLGLKHWYSARCSRRLRNPKPLTATMAPERKKCGHMGRGGYHIYIYTLY